MLRMVSHPRRPQSGHITCYLNRTYHLLPTGPNRAVDRPFADMLTSRLLADLGKWGFPIRQFCFVRLPVALASIFSGKAAARDVSGAICRSVGIPQTISSEPSEREISDPPIGLQCFAGVHGWSS
jgi:hypothetical protein